MSVRRVDKTEIKPKTSASHERYNAGIHIRVCRHWMDRDDIGRHTRIVLYTPSRAPGRGTRP